MIKRLIKKFFPSIVSLRRRILNIGNLYNMELDEKIHARQINHPNPLAKFGRKGFSQSDEDGITFEIIRRLGLDKGVFAEFGVGDGTENNTLSLLGLGWTGFWVGGEKLGFDVSKSKKLLYQREWVTVDNIYELFSRGLNGIHSENIDVISLDLDGNDLYFCEELLSKSCAPHLFIVEYNAKFPPPMRFSITYDAKHIWRMDDYQGASLTTLNDLFEKFDYKLVCCNAATGTNAFFVKREWADKFPEVPDDLSQIYSPPHFFLFDKFAHPKSIKTIEVLISTDI